jgi:short-subunit dehydrogenase
MLNVDLLAPILLTRAALPSLRASGDAMVVNITSDIAGIGAPFYATYAAAMGDLARFGEALRRELKGEGIHVLTVYPGGTDTPMTKTGPAPNLASVANLLPRWRMPRSKALKPMRSR